jgi:hypothetical protein
VLPDPNDRHVVALRAGAQAIVASNVKDFPESALKPFALGAIHPVGFLLDELHLAARTFSSYSPGRRRTRRALP